MNQSREGTESHYEHILNSTMGVPFSEGNTIEVLNNGNEIFPAMLDAIRSAREHIDFLTFVYWQGNIAREMANALADKASEGLRVRVILDSWGAWFMSKELTDLMEENGVQIEWFRPLSRWKVWKTDNRTHRKILICDKEVAFTGGVGIAEEWEGDARNPSEWRETHFRIRGPAVFGLYAAFMENWIETGRELELESGWDRVMQHHGEETCAMQVIRTSASVRWSDIVMLYQTLLKMAQEKVMITTAYFNPNDSMVSLLEEAAGRGVEIDIMIPGKYIDHRVVNLAGGEHFEPLLDAGVRIWVYQKTMLHSKVVIVDDTVCCIGSANFNHRSMLKDDEVNIIALSEALAGELVEAFQRDLEDCEALNGQRWKKRSVVRKGVEGVMRLFKQEV